MSSAAHLIQLAEDQLTEYSTEARKIEKLRRKFGFVVPYPQQQAIRDQIAAEIPTHFLAQVVETNRQVLALPCWGIGGLGLLFGISAQQPLDFLATGIGFFLAIKIQRWGWSLQAKRLVLKTLDEIKASVESIQAGTADDNNPI
jgi:hypothetical protein